MHTPDTIDTRQLVIYQISPRQHGPDGRLTEVTADLPRIADLGVDVVYLMPIHPIGVSARKGGLGSPYAIRDYRTIDPVLGSEQDFEDLLAAAHAIGLRVMMDVVVNHTARDSVLVAEHPEFFHRDAHGRPYSTVPAWTDIIDLQHPNPELTRYLIDTLAQWVDRGVDGFRCDVASLVPLQFWQAARAELADRKPDLLWLAETPHISWVAQRRSEGLPTWSDAQMYAAFDMEYQYDIWSMWQAVVRGAEPVGRFLELLRWQQGAYPEGKTKLRYVENHDNFRIMRFAPNRTSALAWSALMAFAPGPFMLFAGQESGARHWPNLFEHDPIEFYDYPLTEFTVALSRLKHHPAQLGAFSVVDDEPIVQLHWRAAGSALLGLFNVSGAQPQDVAVPLPDGRYSDLLDDAELVVSGGRTTLAGPSAVVEVPEDLAVPAWRTRLLDVFLPVEELGEDDEIVVE